MTNPPPDDFTWRMFKAVVFTLVGVGLMAGALYWADSTRRFVARAATVPGLVVRLNAGGAHPEVLFTTPAGKAIEYPQGGLIWGYRTGDKVEVLYDAQNQVGPVINTAGALWGFTLMTFLLGAVFVGVAQLAWRRPDLVG